MQQVGSVLGNLKNMAADMGQEIDRQNKQLDKVGAKVKQRLNILHSFILNFLYRPSMLTTKLVTPIREQRTSWSDGWDCTFNHEDVIFLICGCVCMRFLYYIYTIRYRYGVRAEITFKKDCFNKFLNMPKIIYSSRSTLKILSLDILTSSRRMFLKWPLWT